MPSDSGSFTGKVALVTGAANGIGRCCTSRPAKVILPASMCCCGAASISQRAIEATTQDVIPDGLDRTHSVREPLSSACSRLGDLPCGFSVVRFNLHVHAVVI